MSRHKPTRLNRPLGPKRGAVSARQKRRRQWGIVGILALAGGLLAWLKFGTAPPLTDWFAMAFSSSNQAVRPAEPRTNSLSQGPGLSEPQGPGQELVSPLPDDAVELINLASEFLSVGRPDRAIPLLTKAMTLNPKDEEVQFNLGFAYAKAGLTNQAIQHYQECLRIYPDYIEAHINLGNLLVNLRRYGEAMDHFSAALSYMPDHPSALNNLAKCLAAQGLTEEAAGKLSQALRLNPRYLEARYNLGLAYTTLQRFDEAIAEFAEVLRQEPSFTLADGALARARALKAAQSSKGAP